MPTVIPQTLPTNVMTDGLRATYGVDGNANDFIVRLMASLNGSGETTIYRVGQVLETARHEFGLGNITPLIIITAGHLLLGNPLFEENLVLAAPFNPSIMSCAALGAIYYGWKILPRHDREVLVVNLSNGLQVGSRLVGCVIDAAVDITRQLLDRNNLKELRNHIGKAIELFNSNLGESNSSRFREIASIYDDFKNITGGRWGETLSSEKCTIGKVADEILLLIYLVAGNSSQKPAWNAATTCGQKISFSYAGSVADGVEIFLPDASFRVTAEFLRSALDTFSGRQIWGGFSLTKPTPGGFGEWVRDNSANMNSQPLTPRHASFIAAVLRAEGSLACAKVGNSVRLVFR